MTKREKLERAVAAAVRELGGEAVVSDSEDEPVASLPYGRSGWLDVYIRSSR